MQSWTSASQEDSLKQTVTSC